MDTNYINDWEESLAEKAEKLEKVLAAFQADAKVMRVTRGPTVTRYELEPELGVKVGYIMSLSDDIALNMNARSMRIEAPVPGEATIGIEIENDQREKVPFKEMAEAPEFVDHDSKLAFIVGRDIDGNAVVADLAKMPHLLIAGMTGSGKTVCINTIIASILHKAKPEEVKMILIDPKMIELSAYNGTPHLMMPVVTDVTKAEEALNWAVAEMTERYKKFASYGVRDIGSFNNKMKKLGNREEILPKIVIIIDEFSDLLMFAENQIEGAICRLTQLAHVAGMHLVIATQRPSVDVITSLIKATIPSRIAFTVSSSIDSRTIIDMPGAEHLAGSGDMLFSHLGLNKPKRIQGPFISEQGIRELTEKVKNDHKEIQCNLKFVAQIGLLQPLIATQYIYFRKTDTGIEIDATDYCGKKLEIENGSQTIDDCVQNVQTFFRMYDDWYMAMDLDDIKVCLLNRDIERARYMSWKDYSDFKKYFSDLSESQCKEIVSVLVWIKGEATTLDIQALVDVINDAEPAPKDAWMAYYQFLTVPGEATTYHAIIAY